MVLNSSPVEVCSIFHIRFVVCMDCQVIKDLGNRYIPNVTYQRLVGSEEVNLLAFTINECGGYRII